MHSLWVEDGKPSDKSVEELLSCIYLPQGLPTLPLTIITIGDKERDYLFLYLLRLILRRGDKWSEEDEEDESGTTAGRPPLLFCSLREVFTAQGIALQAIAQGKRLSLLI